MDGKIVRPCKVILLMVMMNEMLHGKGDPLKNDKMKKLQKKGVKGKPLHQSISIEKHIYRPGDGKVQDSWKGIAISGNIFADLYVSKEKMEMSRLA